MALSVTCEHCGRIIVAPESEAGQTVLCLACGARVLVPHPPAPSSYVQDAPAAPVAIRPRRKSRGHWLIFSIAIMCSAALGVVAAVILRPNFFSLVKRPPASQPVNPAPPVPIPPVAADNWETTHRAQILSLANDAHKLAAAGKLQEADAKYQQLEQLVEDHEIADSYLRERLARARDEEKKIFDKLVDLRANGNGVVVTPPNGNHNPPANPPTHPTETATVRPPPATTRTAVAPPATTQGIASVPPQPFVPEPPVTRPTAVRPPPVVVRPPEELTDEEIGQAIQRGADFLVEMFENGKLKHTPGGNYGFANNYYTGMDSLCVYALMAAGQATNDPRLDVRGDYMKGLIDGMKGLPMNIGFVETYARSVRCTALAYFNRPEDHDALFADADWLLKTGQKGAYGYGRAAATSLDGPPYWDNSNTQFALLALWSAAEAGFEVPADFWQDAEAHWTRYQLENGQWTYRERSYQPVFGGREGALSMTAAGIATLLVTHDYLDAPKVDEVGREPFPPPLMRALAWLEKDNNCVTLPDADLGYFQSYSLYGVERVGLASGFKYLGKHNWYRELARQVIAQQKEDGSWNDNRIETAFMLLFLARGRHPILMNKLRFEGYWANRPRDLANLARFASKQLERPVNWQIVNLDRSWTDWMDSPILYISSHAPPQMGEADYEKLRMFAENGGLIFTEADGSGEDFNRWVDGLAARLFPQYQLKDLPTDHDLYNSPYPVDPKPPLKAVSNGSRILLLHSPTDISKYWQQRAQKTGKSSFDLGVNLFMYVNGKTDFRNRLASPYLPAPADAPKETVKLARLRYMGNWDPEPAAFVRFGRFLQRQTNVGLDVQTVAMKDLKPGVAPVAYLTGTAGHTPSDPEAKAVRKYVESGGVLIIDSCGGSPEFTDSVLSDFLPTVFANQELAAVGPEHPLLVKTARDAGAGDLDKPALRTYVLQRFGRGGAPRLRGMRVGKGYVIFSPLDMTTGLLGTHTWGILGYQPRFAQGLLQALVMGVKGAANTTQP